jgi:hypothetical protein
MNNSQKQNAESLIKFIKENNSIVETYHMWDYFQELDIKDRVVIINALRDEYYLIKKK